MPLARPSQRIGRWNTIFQKFNRWSYKNKVIAGFTEKYNVNQLVYYEEHQMYVEAARREKCFKNWCRQWKLNLIEGFNPSWRDLYDEICS